MTWRARRQQCNVRRLARQELALRLEETEVRAKDRDQPDLRFLRKRASCQVDLEGRFHQSGIPAEFMLNLINELAPMTHHKVLERAGSDIGDDILRDCGEELKDKRPRTLRREEVNILKPGLFSDRG